MKAFLVLNCNSDVDVAVEALVMASSPDEVANAIGASFTPFARLKKGEDIIGTAHIKKEDLVGVRRYRHGSFVYPIGPYERKNGIDLHIRRIPLVIQVIQAG